MNIIRKTASLVIAALLLSLCCSAAGTSRPALLLMVYMAGSDLETEHGAASAELSEMSASIPPDGSVEVLVLAAGAKTWHNNLDASPVSVLRVTPSGCEVVEQFPLRSMGEPETLSEFLRFSYLYTYADEYALIFWDHGAGPMEGICFDENFSSGGRMDCLTLDELSGAIAQSPFCDVRFSWIGFDACLMASVETAWAVAPYADCMIASQETEPAGGWDYGFLSDVSLCSGGGEAGTLIVQRYALAYEDSMSPITLSCVDLSHADAIAREADRLFGSLPVGRSSYPAYASARVNSKTIGCSLPFDYDLIDFIDFLRELDRTEEAECGELLSLLEDSVVCSVSNRPFCGGLSVYYPFYNKGNYLSPWSSRVDALSFSKGYASYLDRTADIWMGEPLADWKNVSLRQEQSGDAVLLRMQLTPEQAAQVASARLVVVSEDVPGCYFIRYRSDSVFIGEDGIAESTYRQESLYFTDHEGKPVTGSLGYFIRDGELFLKALLMRDFDLENLTDDWIESAYLVYTPVEGGAWRLSQILSLDTASGLWGRSFIRIEDWDYVEFIEYGYAPKWDENGQLLPYSEWEDTDWVSGYDLEVADFGSPRLLCMQDAYPRYAMLEITDLQDRTVTSDLIPLENPYRHAVEFGGVTEADLGYCTVKIEGVTVTDGDEPQIEVLFRAEEKDAGASSAALTDAALNGVPIGQTLFGSSVKPGGISAAVIRPKHIVSTGQDRIRTISFTVRCRDEDGAELAQADLTLELELDARALAAAAGATD